MNDKKPRCEGRVNEGFIAPDRFAGVVRQNFANDSHRRKNQDVNFRMTQEPEQMLPEQRAATAADIGDLPGNHQAGREEKAGVRNFVHQLHDAGRFQGRKREQQEERGHELRPDEKRKAHPIHTRRPHLNDRRNKVNGAQERGRDQEHHADQPKRLAVRGDDCRQWRIGCPTCLRGATGDKETDQHDHTADREALVTGHVDSRERHIRRANLQGNHVIAERGKRQRNNAKEHHDRSVHRTKGIVQIGGHGVADNFPGASTVPGAASPSIECRSDPITGMALPGYASCQRISIIREKPKNRKTKAVIAY